MKKRLLFLGLLTLLLLSVLPLLSCVGHTHTLTQYAALAPTCTSDGFAAYEACSGCDYTTYEPIPATGHTYPDTYDTTARLHRRTCTVCAYTDEAEHTFDEGTVTREPTCTERGETTYTCTVCAMSRAVSTGGTGAHTYGTDAYTVYESYHNARCSACGDVQSSAHTFEERGRTEAQSCLESTVIHERCVCGTERDRTVPPDEDLHEPSDTFTVTVPAGATTAGQEARLCTVCGVAVEERILAPIAELALPRLFLTGDWQSATKTHDVTLAVRYVPLSGAEVSCYGTVHWQGATSSSFPKKNYTLKLYKDETLEKKQKIDLGWGKESKYCLKANWVDCTQARNIVACRLWRDLVATRPASALRDRLLGLSTNAGAIDGFPILVYMNGEFHGLYTLNVPKDDWMFDMTDAPTEAIIGADSWETDFTEDVGAFTLDKNGDYKANGGAWELKYFGNEKTTADPTWVTESFNRLIRFVRDSDDATFRAGIDQYLDVDAAIDYLIYMYAIYMRDNSAKNILWVTYDGTVWFPSIYDQDGTFGMAWDGIREAPPDVMLPKVEQTGGVYTTVPNIKLGSTNLVISRLLTLFPERILARYAVLREEVLTEEHIMERFDAFVDTIPEVIYEAERERWPDVPSWGLFERDYVAAWVPARLSALDAAMIEIFEKVCHSSLGAYGG